MATGDLTTLASVREYLQLPATQTDQDALIGTLITAGSKMIHRYTGRQLYSVGTATYKFRYKGGGYLSLAPYDLRSVTSVTMDTDGTAPANTLLTADDYRLLPVNADDGVYTGLELRGYSPAVQTSATDHRPARELTIVGTWGFAATPTDVALAANALVGWMLRNHSTIPSQGMEDLGQRFGPTSWPTGVRQMLAPYIAPGFGSNG